MIYNKSSQQSFVKIAKWQIPRQKRVKIMFLNEMGVKCTNKSERILFFCWFGYFVCFYFGGYVCLFLSFLRKFEADPKVHQCPNKNTEY